MAVNGRTAQPIGHHDFCLVHPAECAVQSDSRVRVKLTPEHWNELNEVNKTVNTSIRPETDQELFGKPEVWAYPTTAGDCEDFVLLKRRMLIDKGWPVGGAADHGRPPDQWRRSRSFDRDRPTAAIWSSTISIPT